MYKEMFLAEKETVFLHKSLQDTDYKEQTTQQKDR